MKIQVVSDTELNDSNKTLTMPDGHWRVESIRIEYTATGDAGNRLMEIRYLDKDGNIVWATELLPAYVASDVRITNFSPSDRLLAAVDAGNEGSQHCAAAVPSGGSIQVLDVAAIQAAADDMVVRVVVSTDN